MWVSHDAGGSWISAGLHTIGFTQVMPDPSSNAVYALEAAGGRLLATIDHGATWVQRGRVPHQGNQDVQLILAIDPAPPSTLYMGVLIPLSEVEPGVPNFAQQTFRSTDAGAHWAKVGPGGFPVAVGPHHEVYAGSFRSRDGGATWQAGSFPPSLPAGYTAGQPHTLYCFSYDLGVVVSHDAALSWQLANQGLDSSRVEAFAVDAQGSALYASLQTQGVLKSSPPGSPWQPVNHGLPNQGDLPRNTLAVDPSVAGHLYLGWSPQFVDAGGLAESVDGGASWQQIQPSSGACRFEVASLAIEPMAPQTLFATGALAPQCSTDAGVCSNFKSVDGGSTWSCLPYAGASLKIAPSDPAVEYAFFLGFDATRINRSTDGGLTWVPADLGIPKRVAWIRDLAVDPTNAQRLLTTGSDGSVWISTNGGQSWTLADHGLPSAPDFLAIDPRQPAVLYASSGALGVYRSLNSGLNWHPYVGGLPPLGFPFAEIGPIIFDAGPQEMLYIAVSGNGLFASTP